ncbi:MAG: hypothetical protein OER86_02820 [Phycisphaerae bacterium]|nr:hypothetical protein [Phycisphaerae bacterium]
MRQRPEVKPGRRPGSRREAGAVYIMILVVCMIMTVIGVSAIGVERVRLRRANLERHLVEAEALAISAVEHALLAIEETSAADPNWRDLLKDHVHTLPMGQGSISWTLLSRSGGSLSTDPEKQFVVVGTGTRGEAQHTLSIRLRPGGIALGCLTSALHAHDDMNLGLGAQLQSNWVISTNADLVSNGASIFCDISTAGNIQINGGTHFGDLYPLSDLRGTPGSTDAMDFYLLSGTVIDITTLPQSGGEYVLSGGVLSPASNPFDTNITNPEGIYVIDCQGENLVIENIRVVGTLVIDGMGDTDVATIRASVNMTPAVPGFPAVVAKKDLTLAMSNAALSESALATNFNPTLSPYDGDEDTDTADTYPSIIRGLVYSGKHLTFDVGHSRIHGTVVALKNVIAQPSAVIELTYDQEIVYDPPPGFFVPNGEMRISSFSWQRYLD